MIPCDARSDAGCGDVAIHIRPPHPSLHGLAILPHPPTVKCLARITNHSHFQIEMVRLVPIIRLREAFSAEAHLLICTSSIA